VIVALIAGLTARFAGAQVVTPNRQTPKIQGVTYRLRPGVKHIDVSALKMLPGGRHVLPGEKLQPGDVVVDLKRKTSFKVLDVDPDGSMRLVHPPLREVLEDLRIPQQRIDLRNAPYRLLQKPGAMRELSPKSVRRATKGGGQKLMDNQVPLDKDEQFIQAQASHRFVFNPEVPLPGLAGNQSVIVKLNGEIGGGLYLDVGWSAFGSYHFGLVGAEYLSVTAKIQAVVNQDIKIPLYAIPVDFDLGHLDVGIFLIVHIDGSIVIVANIDEGLYLDAGIQGTAVAGYPVTEWPYINQPRSYFRADCNLTGVVNCYAHVWAGIDLNCLDCDVFGAGIEFGPSFHASINKQSLDYEADIDACLGVTVVDDEFDLFNLHANLFKWHKNLKTSLFEFQVTALCAYRNQFGGRVKKNLMGMEDPVLYKCTQCGSDCFPTADGGPPLQCSACGATQSCLRIDPFAIQQPYVGPVSLQLYQQGQPMGSPVIVTTDPTDGTFWCDFQAQAGAVISKGDSVTAQVLGDPTSLIDPVQATIPFDNIRLTYADFYAELAPGSVDQAYETLVIPGSQAKGKPKKLIAYVGPVSLNLADVKNPAAVQRIQTPTDSQGRFCFDSSQIMPNQYANAILEIKGFQLQSFPPPGQPTTHHVVFSKFRDDVDTPFVHHSESGQRLQDPLGSVAVGAQHFLRHHLTARNDAGGKAVEEPAYLTIMLGGVPNPPPKGEFVVKRLHGSNVETFTPVLDKLFFEYFYNLCPPIPLVLYHATGEMLLKPAAPFQPNPRIVDGVGVPSPGSANEFDWRWDEHLARDPSTPTDTTAGGTLHPGNLKLHPNLPGGKVPNSGKSELPPGLTKPAGPLATHGDAAPMYTAATGPGRNPFDTSPTRATWREIFQVETRYAFTYKGVVFEAQQYPPRLSSYTPSFPQEDPLWSAMARVAAFVHTHGRMPGTPLNPEPGWGGPDWIQLTASPAQHVQPAAPGGYRGDQLVNPGANLHNVNPGIKKNFQIVPMPNNP
jgi:hypothetical protein